MANPSFHTNRQGDVTVVSLIEGTSVPTWTELEAVLDERPPKIVIDITGLSAFPTQVVGLIIGVHKRISPGGGKVRLCNSETDLESLVRIARFNATFRKYCEVFPTLERALEDF